MTFENAQMFMYMYVRRYICVNEQSKHKLHHVHMNIVNSKINNNNKKAKHNMDVDVIICSNNSNDTDNNDDHDNDDSD